MNEKEATIERIIEMEQEMFQQVNTGDDAYGRKCQQRRQTFRVMRWMTHSVLSGDTLRSYLSDLVKAKEEGRNLMTEKYALMDDLIPHPVHNKIFLEDIISNELAWMIELKEKYPNLIQGKEDFFKKYMTCEYETYSDETLRYLRNNVLHAKENGENLPEKRYRNLFQRMGYHSIEAALQSMDPEQRL